MMHFSCIDAFWYCCQFIINVGGIWYGKQAVTGHYVISFSGRFTYDVCIRLGQMFIVISVVESTTGWFVMAATWRFKILRYVEAHQVTVIYSTQSLCDLSVTLPKHSLTLECTRVGHHRHHCRTEPHCSALEIYCIKTVADWKNVWFVGLLACAAEHLK